MEGRDTLIERNIGLVYAQLNRFNLRQDPDAESIAFEALLKASENFDESTGNKFSTLAVVYIYNALCGYLRTLNKVRKLDIVSLNAEVEINGTMHEYQEVIADSTFVDEDYIKKEKCLILSDCFNKVYNKLKSDKQKRIIEHWKGGDFEDAHKDIADSCGVSQSYVTQTITIFKTDVKRLMEVTYGDS